MATFTIRIESPQGVTEQTKVPTHKSIWRALSDTMKIADYPFEMKKVYREGDWYCYNAPDDNKLMVKED